MILQQGPHEHEKYRKSCYATQVNNGRIIKTLTLIIKTLLNDPIMASPVNNTQAISVPIKDNLADKCLFNVFHKMCTAMILKPLRPEVKEEVSPPSSRAAKHNAKQPHVYEQHREARCWRKTTTTQPASTPAPKGLPKQKYT